MKQHVRLDQEHFERLFPFYFVLDRSMRILQRGKSLEKLIGAAEEPFESRFRFIRPGLGIRYAFDSIIEYRKQIFILRNIGTGGIEFQLKGEFLPDEANERLIFCGSPWITSEERFTSLGLKLNDFALHDSVADFLHVLKAQQMSYSDLFALNEQIEKSRRELADKNMELQDANMELDRFVYSTSHDLRAPLLAITGLIDLIVEKSPGNAEVIEYSRIIKDTSHRLDGIIREILTYAKNRSILILPEPVDIEKMVHTIFDSARYYSNYPVELGFEMKHEDVFVSDNFRLQSVLSNIITNAIKYRRDDGTPAKVTFRSTVTAEKGIFEVEDNGQGIPKERLPRIFEMFYRASNSSPGSGLGLYICHEVVKKLGGEIHVQSEPGRGTTFTVTLPNLKPE
ncbi:MAG: ATP-binding protein [Bacteroidota bacterium]